MRHIKNTCTYHKLSKFYKWKSNVACLSHGPYSSWIVNISRQFAELVFFCVGLSQTRGTSKIL